MMNKNLKTIGYAFVENLSAKGLTKDGLFKNLFDAVGKNCDLDQLRLPTNSAVAYLESCKAKCKIKAYEPRIADTFNKLTKVNKLEHKKELLEALKFMTPSPRDYAIMTLDKYIKLNPDKNNIDGFLRDFHQYKLQQNRLPISKPNYTRISEGMSAVM